MAEIKSTLELALERTRRISISQEEKEEIKRKETLKKATGIFHRYMEDTLSLNELLRGDRTDRREGKTHGSGRPSFPVDRCHFLGSRKRKNS